MEIIIKECILQTIRETIPVEELLKLYMNETVENAVEVHEREEIISQEPIFDKSVAGVISGPSPMTEAERKEEADTLSKIKAASNASSNSDASITESGSGSGVSFNMKNNQVIPIENISNEIRDKSSKNYDDDYDDINGDDIYNEDDEYDEDGENVKLSIGDNVELSVDPFPSDQSDGGGDDENNIDLKIEEIPDIEDF